MARVEWNEGSPRWIGKLGNAVYRRHRDETLVTKVPDFDDYEPTEDQERYQKLFVVANSYASKVAKTPELRALYEEPARIEDMRIRDIAHRDFSHPPVVEAIDVSGYAGSPGQVIRVEATDDTGVVAVDVMVITDGRVVEQGPAQLEISGLWAYVAREEVPTGSTVRIRATARDRAKRADALTAEIVVTEEPADRTPVQFCIPNANLHAPPRRKRADRASGPLRRTLEPVLRSAAAEFPVLVLVGPRGSGATTLLMKTFGRTHEHVSLEHPDVRALAAADPRAFVERYAPPVIFDQIQLAPNLLSHLAEDIEGVRPGRYVLTTSTSAPTLEQIAQVFGDRAVAHHLMPFSFREAGGRRGAPLPWEAGAEPWAKGPAFGELWEAFIRGGYPELVAGPERDVHRWHAGYVQAYLERDVRLQRRIGDLHQFESFLRALAVRSGRLLHLSEIARELGLAVNTVKAWIAVLESTGQIVVLQPFASGSGRRLVKTPKVYFTDVGTLCYLTGVRDPEHAASGPMSGPIVETAVLSEIRKALAHRGIAPSIRFWRTSKGVEVDFLVETPDGLVSIDVTASATPRPAMAAGIDVFWADVGEEGVVVGRVDGTDRDDDADRVEVAEGDHLADRVDGTARDSVAARPDVGERSDRSDRARVAERTLRGYVVHTGDVRSELRPGVVALPFSQL